MPKLVPGKADQVRQEAHVEEYRKPKKNKEEGDVILFMVATHPLHNPALGGGWINRGKEMQIKSNTSRQRLSINGAVDIETMTARVRFDDTINAASTSALIAQIEAAYPETNKITFILRQCSV